MTTKTIALITDIKLLDKAIVSIATRGKKLDADIQLAGLSCLDMLDKHGNIGPLERLLFALPKGARKNAFIEWAVTFGKATINEGPDKKDKPFLFNREAVTDLVKADEKKWYAFQLEKPLDLNFSIKAMAAMLVKKAEQAAAREGAVLDDDHADKLAALKTLAGL